jgi:hypothetical protein
MRKFMASPWADVLALFDAIIISGLLVGVGRWLGNSGLMVSGIMLITFFLSFLGLTFFRHNLVALFGLTLIAVGAFLNFTCMILNGGMPLQGASVPFSFSVPVSIATQLAFLCDRFQIGPVYASLGDLLAFSSVPLIAIGFSLELYWRIEKRGKTNET